MQAGFPVDGRAAHRRGKVIDAARRLFAAAGFHNTGMAGIAAASNVRIGQIYRDFSSKDDLMAAIVEADFAAFFDTTSLRIAVEQCDIASVISAITELLECRPCGTLMPEIFAEAARNPRIANIVIALDARFRDALMDALAAIAPGDIMRLRREQVVGTIMVFIIGLCQRPPAKSPCIAAIRAFIVGQLAALESAACEKRQPEDDGPRIVP